MLQFLERIVIYKNIKAAIDIINVLLIYRWNTHVKVTIWSLLTSSSNVLKSMETEKGEGTTKEVNLSCT